MDVDPAPTKNKDDLSQYNLDSYDDDGDRAGGFWFCHSFSKVVMTK